MVNQPTGADQFSIPQYPPADGEPTHWADQFSIPIPFPNSKPWINRDIKVLWYRKRRAFMAGDNEDTQREIQRELRRELRWAKEENRGEAAAEQPPRGRGAGVRTITGMRLEDHRRGQRNRPTS